MDQDESIAWAAGLFEGEGCMVVRRNRYIQASLQMADRDVVERFARIAGFGSIIHRDRSEQNHSDMWLWQAAAKKDLVPFLKLLLPYFGERRAEKARELIAVADANPDRRGRGLGRRWPMQN